jgi:hypothetical protein
MFSVSNDKVKGSAHQTTSESSLLSTWVSPTYADIQCGLNRQDYPELDLAVTQSSMPPWPQLTHLTPSFSGPLSSSKPKSESLSREVTTREANLRAQQIRNFQLQNPKATQQEIASPSGLEYLMESAQHY